MAHALTRSVLVALHQLLTAVLPFYDGPSPPPGIFDGFLAVPGPISNTITTQSFAQLIVNSSTPEPARLVASKARCIPNDRITHFRSTHGTVPSLTYDEAYLKAMLNETMVSELLAFI